MKFSDKIRENIIDGWSGDASCLDGNLAREAADIIDELENVLKICRHAFEYLGYDENQLNLASPREIKIALELIGDKNE